VPFAEFEMIGFPLRGPDDLLRALQSVAIGKGGAGGTVVMEVTTKQGVAP
jgi:hypothetical protein